MSAVAGHPVIAWYAVMVDAAARLSDEDADELVEWERQHLTGSGEVGTSDWPGWSRYIDMDTFWPWPERPWPVAPENAWKLLERLASALGTDVQMLTAIARGQVAVNGIMAPCPTGAYTVLGSLAGWNKLGRGVSGGDAIG